MLQFRNDRIRCRPGLRFAPRNHGSSFASLRAGPRHSLDHHAGFPRPVITGVEILISHPRFYWGETGNVLTPALFEIPIPASRATVPTGYGYVLPDQNGWSRYLHFQSAWVAVLTGLLYVAVGFVTGHFQRNLFPARAGLSPRGFAERHLPASALQPPA